MVNPTAVDRYPFLTLEHAAFFLQVPRATARWMYEEGELPKALRLDGGIFEPVPGRLLIPYAEFKQLVSGEAAVKLRLWQQGQVDIPKSASRTSPAPRLSDVVYTDNGRDDR
jgi:hypothetical protein